MARDRLAARASPPRARGKSSSRMRGRIAVLAAERGAGGRDQVVRRAVGARRTPSGSISKVRMRLGYRLLKSNTRRSRAGPAAARARVRRAESDAPPRCAARSAPRCPPTARRDRGSRRRRCSTATRSSGMPVRRCARSPARTSELLDDLERQPGVGPVVARTRRGRAGTCAGPRRRGRGPRPLALAQHLARDGVERVVVHPHERAAQSSIPSSTTRPGIDAWPLPK